MRKPDGYVDENVRDTLVKKGKHYVAPALTHSARNGNFAAYHVLIEWGIARAIPFLVEATKAVDNFHIQRKHFVRLVHRVGDPQHASLLLQLLKQFPPKKGENARSEMLAALCVALGDLGSAAAKDALLAMLDTDIEEVGSDSQWNLKNAVAYALGQLGDQRALASFTKHVTKAQSYADLQAFARYWAAAYLAARSRDAKVKAKVVGALRDLAAPLESKSEDEVSIASTLEGSANYIAPQLAIHLGLVELGEPADALRVLAGTVTANGATPMKASQFQWDDQISPALYEWSDFEFDLSVSFDWPVVSSVQCLVASSAVLDSYDTPIAIQPDACNVTINGPGDASYVGPIGAGMLAARADLDHDGNGHVAVQLDFDDTMIVPEYGGISPPISVTVQLQSLTGTARFGDGQYPAFPES